MGDSDPSTVEEWEGKSEKEAFSIVYFLTAEVCSTSALHALIMFHNLRANKNVDPKHLSCSP